MSLRMTVYHCACWCVTGYKVLTVTDASRGVASDTTAAALKDMRDTGKQVID